MADGPAPMAVDPPSVDLRLSPEEEETLQYRRLEVDERNVRKISKKFQTYAMALRSHQEKVAPESGETSGIDPLDEPRRALEVELGAFLLVMQKSSLVVQAEIMQAQEYEESKERINQEYGETQEEIERLREELRDAELFRERKKEYDVIAAKINNLPPRSELNQSIAELEDEITAIQAEQEATREVLAAKRSMMEDIRQRIQEMILHGKDSEAETQEVPDPSRPGTPLLTNAGNDATENQEGDGKGNEGDGEKIERTTTPMAPSSILNPEARPFLPSSLSQSLHSKPPTSSEVAHRRLNPNNANASPSSRQSSPKSPAGTPARDLPMQSPELEEGQEDGEDIEMGELAEEDSGGGRLTSGSAVASASGSPSRGRGAKRRTAKEDLEEGEASDASSELSSVPD